MLRIMIADDHAMVRDGLKHIIEEQPDLEVAAEAADGREVLDIVMKTALDIVLLDIAMPRMNGLEVLRLLRKELPRLPVLILSMYPEEQYAVRALRAGAMAYLTKESASGELIAAIRKVASGGKYISLSLAEKLAMEIETDYSRLPHEKLSDRELQVLRLIARGRTNGQMSDDLALSTKTVSTYRRRILNKMRLKSNAELTLYAVKNNLVD
jgi:two-component system, NarL family, invasion response regulator UvrY